MRGGAGGGQQPDRLAIEGDETSRPHRTTGESDGTVGEIAACAESYTGRFLTPLLEPVAPPAKARARRRA